MWMNGLLDLVWWQLVLITLGLTHITIAAVTIFLHRHQAHRALDLHAIPSHFFRFWLWLTTGMVTKEWAAIHRKHHAKCETAEDPHSPKHYGINRVVWGGVVLYVKESKNAETMERFGHGTPNDWIENKLYTPWQKSGILVMLAIDFALFGAIPGFLIWGVQMLWIPFWAAGVINGVGHWFGYRNFDAPDMSRNIVPWGILIGGEELHNNHHAYGTSARLSNKWYEFDIGWLYIRILETLGLARVKFIAPQPKLLAEARAVDFDTVQNLIAHRYDLMARYGRSLKAAWSEEVAGLRAKQADWAIHKRQYNEARRSLNRNVEDLGAQDKASLDAVLNKHDQLGLLYRMREELAAIWGRSSASREQLVKQLQDWCARAEASGSAYLAEMSLRVRSYAPAPALAAA